MQLGSIADFLRRLKVVQPDRWFPDEDSPILDGWLTGIAAIWAWSWSLLAYVTNQTRVATATDINLDIISNDYLGNSLPRNPGESDIAYRLRIRLSIFTERGTRAAIVEALTLLNGAAPTIFEPRNATDTGGWGAKGATINTGLGYGVAGGYGSYNIPFQAFVQTNTPNVQSIGGIQGYGSKSVLAFNLDPFSQGFSTEFGAGPANVTIDSVVIGGYGTGSIEYTTGTTELVSASDESVYQAINAVKPVAMIVWVSTQRTAIQTPPQDGGAGASGPQLDASFILDVSRLS